MFLLSDYEVRKYRYLDVFYYVGQSSYTTAWWLRTHGHNSQEECIATVSQLYDDWDYNINLCGAPPSRHEEGIRPAIWISLE